MTTRPFIEQFKALPSELQAKLLNSGFDVERFATFARSIAESSTASKGERNIVKGDLKAPSSDELPSLPSADTPAGKELAELGLAAIQRGELAFCVLAGGMATRMGGVVKALVEAIPRQTFLQLRLRENAHWSARSGQPIPLWMMTSDATDDAIRSKLAQHGAAPHVAAFPQGLGIRLTHSGDIFRDEQGEPSTYATGHGDLPDALKRSGLLDTFVARGGRYVWICNLDNLGATIDPVVLGHFIRTSADVLVEVCEKEPRDRGGIPVHVGSSLQIVEEFRLPKSFDPATVRVFNTNTFLVRAEALAKLDTAWLWFEVEKSVDGRKAIQFERLLQQLTASLPSTYLVVPRRGATTRFMPVKDAEELVSRRKQIEEVAHARGMLPQP